MESKRNVFVVDDSLSIRKAIEHMLLPQGVEVGSAESGVVALAELERQVPDLVICDLVLPDIDGFEVCRRIRNHPKLRKTPVLFISGLVNDDVRHRTVEAGASGLLKKPFSSDELLAQIDNLLAAASSRQVAIPDEARQAMKRLERLRDFRFAVLAGTAEGVLLHQGREAPAAGSDLEQDLLELVESAADVAARLGQGELGGLILESDNGLLLLHGAGTERSLIVCLTGDPLLGQGRYLAQRVARELAETVPAAT